MEKALESSCLSIELSEKIQEIGLKEFSTYARWVIISQKIIYWPENEGMYQLRTYTEDFYESNRKLGGTDIKAPIYDEIWSYLPQDIEKDDEIYWLEQVKGDEEGATVIRYMTLGYDILHQYESKSLVEIVGKMLIWLYEKGYIGKENKHEYKTS
jgi:hypothetical protein